MNILQRAEQLRRAIQIVVRTLSEDEALEIATVYPEYEIGVSYNVGDYFTYGVNNVGDPQLYKVVQVFTSQSDWIPGEIDSLCVPVGLNKAGFTTWSQPAGAHDAYNMGDIVDYNGTLYISLVNSNIYSPEVYPANWEIYTV